MLISTTPFMIELLDVAGKKATGYIGAVGAGETLGDELIVNGTFDEDSGWTKTVSGWTIAGGKGVATAGADSAQLYQANITAITGSLLKVQSTISDFVSGIVQFYFNSGAYAVWSEDIIADGTYTKYGNWDPTVGPYFSDMIRANNTTLKVDNFTAKRVTEPPVTAVHIVSSLNGTTRNWASVESGFDPNKIASWKIYDLSRPGFYLPGVGTFNRGDFAEGNAFFWSNVDLSPYAGTLTDEQLLTGLIDTDQSGILKALKSMIPAAMPTIKGVYVLPDPDLLPESAQFPCVGLKDGDSSFSEGAGKTDDETGSVLIYIYVQILKEEASIMGEGSKKGVLRLMKDLRTELNWSTLNGIVEHFYSSEVMASETMQKGEDVFVQRKGCRFTYER